jgi:eukaryotic-like serine/threonine-protein kinase
MTIYLDECVDYQLNNRYQLLERLGEGGTAITYAAKDLLTNRQVAIKVLSLDRLDNWKKIELFEREAKILQQLNHPAIPKYLDYFELETGDERVFCLVQQLAPGKSLATLIKEGWQPNYETIVKITRQILEILIYLQQLTPPVIHRDLKPENLIINTQDLSSGKVELFLVDFGAVRDTYHHTIMGSTVVGTHGYMAPEQFRGQAFLATDLYGLGTTLIFFLTGKSPLDLPQRQLKFNFRPLIKSYPKQLADWLDKLIEPNYGERFPNAEVALSAFENPQFFKNHLNLKPRRPSYTSISLSQTKEEFTITIPPGFSRQRYNILQFCYLLLCYIPTFLLLFINFLFVLNAILVSSQFFLLFQIVYIVIMIQYINKITRVVFVITGDYFFRKLPTFRLMIYLALFQPAIWMDSITLKGYPIGIGLLCFGLLVLLYEYVFYSAKIKLARDYWRTTYLKVERRKKCIRIGMSKSIKKAEFTSCYFQKNKSKSWEYERDLNFITNELKNNNLCGLLTKAEKLWVLAEINQWLNE